MSLKIKEGVEGYYRYHWAEEDKYISLCGRAVMNTSLSNDMWGDLFASHIRPTPKFCNECAASAEKGNADGNKTSNQARKEAD